MTSEELKKSFDEKFKLLPCPLCGSDVNNYISADNDPAVDAAPYVQIVCPNCGFKWRWSVNSLRRLSSHPIPLLNKYGGTMSEVAFMMVTAVKRWNEREGVIL